MGGQGVLVVHYLLPTNPAPLPPCFLHYVKQLCLGPLCYECLSNAYRSCYPVEWKASLSDLPLGWMKYDALLRFGVRGGVTEASGSRYARIPTWLITCVVDGIILLHRSWVWMCFWTREVLIQHGHGKSHENRTCHKLHSTVVKFVFKRNTSKMDWIHLLSAEVVFSLAFLCLFLSYAKLIIKKLLT